MVRFVIDRHGILNLEGSFPKRLGRRQAVDLSIKKWETIYKNALIYENESSPYRTYLISEGDTKTCALCYKYLWTSKSCSACPIAQHSGMNGCQGTPYSIARQNLNDPKYVKRELDFIKKIRTNLLRKSLNGKKNPSRTTQTKAHSRNAQ